MIDARQPPQILVSRITGNLKIHFTDYRVIRTCDANGDGQQETMLPLRRPNRKVQPDLSLDVRN
jgi:hypothetical protein